MLARQRVAGSHDCGRCFAELSLTAVTPLIPNKDRSYHEPPEKPGGEGWLYSEEQQLKIITLSNNCVAWLYRSIHKNPVNQ